MTEQQRTPEQMDVEQNKAMAILAYFIFFLPLIAAKDIKYARYHANQGLILLIAYVALAIVQSIITGALLAALYYGGWGMLGLISLIFTLAFIGLSVLGILGIVNAAQGKMKPMPLIGRITLIK